MKKIHPIRSLLGLTQLEVATLLGTSRSRWSIFEIGLRDLPPSAQIRLGELLMHVTEIPPTEKQLAAKSSVQHPVLKKRVKQLLLENEFQQKMLIKEINQLQNKLDTQLLRSRLSELLDSRIERGKVQNKLELNLAYKTKRLLSCDHSLPLAKLELKMELLKVEMAFLKSKIKPSGEDAPEQ